MHVDRRSHPVIAERLTDHGPHCEIGHIVIVHDVEVHHVRAGRSTASTSSPNRAKLAAKMEGAIR